MKHTVLNAAMTFMTLLTFISVLACGDDSTSSSSSTGSCCLNGSYYTCPSADDAGECSLDDGPGNCSRDSSKDDTCN